jgi:hypothetical protein
MRHQHSGGDTLNRCRINARKSLRAFVFDEQHTSDAR